jgi:hypothetical protein
MRSFALLAFALPASALLAAIVAAFPTGGQALAEQHGRQITAEHPSIGRVEVQIRKYDQALGIIGQLVRRQGAETECQGVCYFPNSARSIAWRCAPKSKCDLHCDISPPAGGCR